MRPESFSMNPYEVLGVSPNASNEEIQAAYRQHALRWHPDRNPGDDYALRMMQRVNAAWAILKDEQSRAYSMTDGSEAKHAQPPALKRGDDLMLIRLPVESGIDRLRPPRGLSPLPTLQRSELRFTATHADFPK